VGFLGFSAGFDVDLLFSWSALFAFLSGFLNAFLLLKPSPFSAVLFFLSLELFVVLSDVLFPASAKWREYVRTGTTNS
jgi:hypothetical protein